MATTTGIKALLATLSRAGLLHERKGAPPDLHIDEARIELATFWHSMLRDVPDEDVAAALASYLRDPTACQWYPQPGQILARVPGRRAAAIDTADEAWGRVLRGIRQHGSWTPPGRRQVEDPDGGEPRWVGWDWDPARGDAEAIRAGIDACGGWRDLCAKLTPDTEITIRASFRAAYRATRSREQLSGEEQVLRRLAEGRAQPRLEVVNGGPNADR